MTAPDIARHSCAAVAIIVGQRLRIDPPHRETIRFWAVRWCQPVEDYVATPGRFRLRDSGVEKIMSNLTEAPRQPGE